MTDNSRYYDIFNCAAGAVYHEEGAAVADEVGVDAVVEAVRADVAHHIETRAAGYEPHVSWVGLRPTRKAYWPT